MNYVEKRAPTLKYIFLDTPGQIEVFNWSASGSIITESFATSMPTVYIYVVDTPRCSNPQTFMSNMLYACSLFYKSRLPLILVFTKTDITKHTFAVEWMKSSDKFEEACRNSNANYMSNLTQSMSLMLSEFYNNFSCVGVSAITGDGLDALFEALEGAALDYESGYKKDLEQRKADKAKLELERQQTQIEKVRAHLSNELDPNMHRNSNAQTNLDEDMDDIKTTADDYDDEELEDDGAEKIEYEKFMKMVQDGTGNI